MYPTDAKSFHQCLPFLRALLPVLLAARTWFARSTGSKKYGQHLYPVLCLLLCTPVKLLLCTPVRTGNTTFQQYVTVTVTVTVTVRSITVTVTVTGQQVDRDPSNKVACAKHYKQLVARVTVTVTQFKPLSNSNTKPYKLDIK